MNTMTKKVRAVMVVLFALTTLVGLIGWLWFGLDPKELIPIYAQVSSGLFIGEASNIGKRATFKKEAVQ
jgi:hypothetical protein